MTVNENAVANTSYVNKDFQKIFPEILDLVKQLTTKWDPSISNESDPGVILLKLNAILADKLNYNIDKNVLECFPLSVTQERNARLLYNQLGYKMKWYIGAITNVVLSWTGDTLPDTYVTIPAFTMVCDSNKDITYTLLGLSRLTSEINKLEPSDVSFPLLKNNDIVFKAIQGKALKYKLNNSEIITSADLDSNRRIYFNEYNIASNGIFISNAGTNMYSEWEVKENLLVESLGNKYFEFGITLDTSTCYIEFPEDVDNLIEDGIEIVYVVTDGILGNIAPNLLNKFIGDLTLKDNTGSTIVLNEENVTIVNGSAATSGLDPESIDDAYKNYKRTIGVFDTLITLRDYISYILRNDLASNGFVSDRYTDPLSSWKIMTTSNGLNLTVNKSDFEFKETSIFNSDGSSAGTAYIKDKHMTAFDLKLYLLEYIINPNDSFSYNQSFNPIVDNNLIKLYLDGSKSISHDFKDLLSPTFNRSNICFFINRYPLDISIVTKNKISSSEFNDIANKIRLNIYKNLDARSIEFGKEITVDKLNLIIISSDERIKLVNLGNINYTTYAIYWDGTRYVELNITDLNQNTIDVILHYDKDYLFSETKPYNAGDYVIYNNHRYKCIARYSNRYGAFNYNDWELSDIKFSFTENPELVLSELSNYVNYYTFDLLINQEASSVSYDIVCVENDQLSKHSDSKEDFNEFGILDIIWDYEDEPTTVPDALEYIEFKIAPYIQFRDEIYAKSILAGTTLLYLKNEKVNLSWDLVDASSNVLTPEIYNVHTLKTNANIDFTKDNPTVRLLNNESLVIFTPNLINVKSYSNYVKYLTNINTTIKTDTIYQLKQGEYIVFMWKEEGSTDSDAYIVLPYYAGSIITPNFNLVANSDLPISSSSESLSIESLNQNSEYISSLTKNEYILNKSKNIVIKDLNLFELTKANPFCFISDLIENDNYVLTFDEHGEKILNSNEYIFYTDEYKSKLYILGQGTKIINSSYSNMSITNKLIDIDYVGIYGIDYLNNIGAWRYVENYSIECLEYAFVILSDNLFVNLSPRSESSILEKDWKVRFNNNTCNILLFDEDTEEYEIVEDYSLSDFSISYSEDTSALKNWITIPIQYLNKENLKIYDGKSILAFNTSADSELILYPNQLVMIRCADSINSSAVGEEIVIQGEAYNNGLYPICLRSENSIIFDGQGYCNTYYYDDRQLIVNNFIYVYGKKLSYSDSLNHYKVSYLNDGGVSFTIFTSNENLEIPFSFKLPAGSYLVKFTNSFALLADSNATINLIYTLTNNDDDTDIKVSTIPVINTELTNLATISEGFFKLLVLENYSSKITILISSRTSLVVFVLQDPYKYIVPENINNEYFKKIEKLLVEFDDENLYDYTYLVSDELLIEDPLNSYSFLNLNHIFNANTICQFDTINENSTIKAYGKK